MKKHWGGAEKGARVKTIAETKTITSLIGIAERA
jgi:hypothetical protein